MQNIILKLLNMPLRGKKRFLVIPSDAGCVERMRRKKWRRFLVDGIVRRTPMTPNMILGQFKVSWRGQI